MKTRLKQVAIAINSAGVIGVDDKLLFSAPADLTRFAAFTDGTVLIAGRNSAQQMINFGARVKKRRPIVVISENGFLTDTTKEDDRFIFYADSLPAALSLAHAVELDFGLNGYTIVGGKRVYDDYFNLVDAGKERPNHVYLFTHEQPAPATSVKLSRDLSQIKKLLEVRMVNSSSVWSEGDVLGKDYTGAVARSKNGRFTYIFDKAAINPDEVVKTGTQLRVKTDGGEVCLDLYGITGWSRKNSIESVDVRLSGGETITVRPHSHAGLNSLISALNMTSFN